VKLDTSIENGNNENSGNFDSSSHRNRFSAVSDLSILQTFQCNKVSRQVHTLHFERVDCSNHFVPAVLRSTEKRPQLAVSCPKFVISSFQ
jgi:hypothetical protein